MTPDGNQNSQPVTSSALPSVIWKSAIEAAWKAFLVLVLGNVAVSLVGGIFQEMTPSLPPGFGEPEATHHARHHWHVWSWLHRSAFYPVFALLFAGILWSRMRRPTTGSGRMAKRLQRIQQALRENWFGLIVGNAFGAMIAAMVAMWVQRFSSFQFVWQPLVQIFGSGIRQGAEFLFGGGVVQRVDSWFHWFGQNQARFDFWLIYYAAICDDLGIPNIKTLGRWLWRKIRKSNQLTPAKATVESVSPSEAEDRGARVLAGSNAQYPPGTGKTDDS